MRVLTLVLHRAADRAISVEHGRYLAAHIAGAECVELQGQDHLWYLGDADSIVAEILRFVTGGRKAFEPESLWRVWPKRNRNRGVAHEEILHLGNRGSALHQPKDPFQAPGALFLHD